jgi:6-pyruvoyltetrahydropterin/6-carboxytetrahydropterin synthase
MPMFLTRRAEFSASHVCANPSLSESQNRALYGDAANPNGHGHNFVVEVTVAGETDPLTGMVFDLRELKQVLNDEVIEPMDHRFLNREVPPFDRVPPTTENIALEIWKRLQPRIDRPGLRLRNVRLYETADLYVDYGGQPV